MKILQNGSNIGVQPGEEQIALVVHGFVQLWNRFEETITREVATHQGLNHSAGEGRFVEDNTLLFRVGTAINSFPSMSMGELSEALAVPVSTATRVVDTLVERGYIERFPDPEDRRVVRVRFTRKGSHLYKFIDGRIAEHIRQLASNLTREEMVTLVKLLTKVASAVKQTLE